MRDFVECRCKLLFISLMAELLAVFILSVNLNILSEDYQTVFLKGIIFTCVCTCITALYGVYVGLQILHKNIKLVIAEEKKRK